MSELAIIAELGEDADLLLAPDQWLENHRIALQERMAELADQLDSIMAAQRLKHELQQKNMVPIRCLDRTETGSPTDVVIRVLPLLDAIAALEWDKRDPAVPSDVANANADLQERIWLADGYDVKAARRLKRRA